MELLGRNGWERLSDEVQSQLIASAVAMRRSEAAPLQGSTKDGAHGQQDQYKLEV
jgi:arginine-tRNA-protein transferase